MDPVRHIEGTLSPSLFLDYTYTFEYDEHQDSYYFRENRDWVLRV